jgi:hypothetical protein
MGIEQTLVIILSVSLFVLVVTSTVMVVLIIMILKSIQRVAKKAEAATDNLSGLITTVGKRVGPAAVSAGVASAIKAWRGNRKVRD